MFGLSFIIHCVDPMPPVVLIGRLARDWVPAFHGGLDEGLLARNGSPCLTCGLRRGDRHPRDICA